MNTIAHISRTLMKYAEKLQSAEVKSALNQTACIGNIAHCTFVSIVEYTKRVFAISLHSLCCLFLCMFIYFVYKYKNINTVTSTIRLVYSHDYTSSRVSRVQS